MRWHTSYEGSLATQSAAAQLMLPTWRRDSCSAVVSLQFAGLCAYTRVLLTRVGKAAHYARANVRATYPGAGGATVVSGSCSGELCGCRWIRRPSAYIGERCAACSEGVRQRAPTVPVAIVVDCPRLKIGLAVSIETWPELLGVGVLAAKKRS